MKLFVTFVQIDWLLTIRSQNNLRCCSQRKQFVNLLQNFEFCNEIVSHSSELSGTEANISCFAPEIGFVNLHCTYTRKANDLGHGDQRCWWCSLCGFISVPYMSFTPIPMQKKGQYMACRLKCLLYLTINFVSWSHALILWYSNVPKWRSGGAAGSSNPDSILPSIAISFELACSPCDLRSLPGLTVDRIWGWFLLEMLSKIVFWVQQQDKLVF